MRRSDFLRGALAGGVALALPRPGRAQGMPAPADEAALYAAAKKEGSLVWYGGAPQQPMQALVSGFQAAYPGVTVNLVRIGGIAQYQRVVAETQAGQYIADLVLIADEPSMADLTARGYLADWKIPTLDRIPDAARLGTTSYVPYMTDVSITYNPTKVTPEEAAILAKDWHGVLDPRFKGRISVSDLRAGVYVAAVEMFMDPKYSGRFGMDYLRALAAQKLAVYNDSTLAVERLVAGENDITLWQSESATYSYWKQGAPIRWVYPPPTPDFGNVWFGLSSHAPHPNAARLFLNWVMSERGQQDVEAIFGCLPVLKGISDTRPITREAWYPKMTERYAIDWSRWAKNADKDWADWLKLLKAGR